MRLQRANSSCLQAWIPWAPPSQLSITARKELGSGRFVADNLQECSGEVKRSGDDDHAPRRARAPGGLESGACARVEPDPIGEARRARGDLGGSRGARAGERRKMDGAGEREEERAHFFDLLVAHRA